MKKTAKKRARATTVPAPKSAPAQRDAQGKKRKAKGATPSPARQDDMPTTPARQSKKETVLALLHQPGGATLAELMTATGWEAHSVRGFISGTVRKALGLTVERSTRNDQEIAYGVTHSG